MKISIWRGSLLAVVSVGVPAAWAIESYWVGVSGGGWSAATNWIPENVPNTAHYAAHVTNETPMSIGGANRQVNRIHASGASHSLYSNNSITLCSGTAAGYLEPGIIVEDGASLSLDNDGVIAKSDFADDVAKKGVGELIISDARNAAFGKDSYRFRTFNVQEGTVRVTSARSSGAINVSNMVVAAGAKFEVQSSAALAPGVKVDCAGDFEKSGSGDFQVTNSSFVVSGKVLVSGGSLILGSGLEGQDATGLNGAESIVVENGTTLAMSNYADTFWTNGPSVSGSGTVTLRGPGSWSIGSLSKTGGVVSVDAASTATNLCIMGGVLTNFTYSVGPARFETTIAGGEFLPTPTLSSDGWRTYKQTGGEVRTCLQANSSNCSNDIFYVMTGGYLLSYANGRYPQGVGLSLSGDAVAELRNAGTYYHRLASGSASHTIRVADNAYLGIDFLQLGENNATGRGTIELLGGTLEVSGGIDSPGGMTDSSPLYADIIFDGGVLRCARNCSRRVWSYNTDPGHIFGLVRAGGAKIDVPADAPTTSLAITWPMSSDVADGVDGGLLKTGYGIFGLRKACNVKGPVVVREGRLISSCTTAGAAAIGVGDVVVGSGDICLRTGARAVAACTAAGATFSYTNAASLVLGTGVALTLGADSAAANSVIRRQGRGVLFVTSEVAGSPIGTGPSLTVKGGVECDATTGLPVQPIFIGRRLTGSSGNVRRIAFAKCSGESVVPAVAVAFNPSTSDSSTIAQITSPAVAVSSDASVGALNVEYSSGAGGLSIADDATLSIGSGNAGSVSALVVNNTLASSSAASVSGGTIRFTTPEAVVAVNGAHESVYPVQINSVLAGDCSMTFAAPALDMFGFRGCVSLGKDNTYTGDTWIEGVEVTARAAGAFGSGTVHVEGNSCDGGALVISAHYGSDVFANALVLAGCGPVYPEKSSNDRAGALAVRKGIRFTGGIELQNAVTVAPGAHAGLSVTEFACPVSGMGSLVVAGVGTLRLSSANSYSGGTVVRDGVLEVDDAGTLGSGPVEVAEGATLRFANASAKSVPNRISGAGTIECAGAAVEFADATEFSGAIVGIGSCFVDGGFSKTGDGLLQVTNALSYVGATAVDAGTLCLGLPAVSRLPAADAVAFHLDVSAESSMTYSGSAVVSWSDADGRGVAFTNAVDFAPVVSERSLNGHASVYFDGTAMRRLIANAAVPKLRTLFIVNRFATSSHPGAGSGWSNVGIIGKLGVDHGLRMENSTYVKADSMFYCGALYRNGVNSMEASSYWDRIYCPRDGNFQTLCAVAASDIRDMVFAIGDYIGGSLKRSYFGDIAEVIAYDRLLSEDERIAVERYLASKWALSEVDNPRFTDVLPTGTSLSVAEGAVVDLAGGSQTVGTLSGAGTVTNSNPSFATLTLSSGTSAFTGSILGDVKLVIDAGATLDLGGGTLHVSRLQQKGKVVNGSITADRICGLGAMIIVR